MGYLALTWAYPRRRATGIGALGEEDRDDRDRRVLTLWRQDTGRRAHPDHSLSFST